MDRRARLISGGTAAVAALLLAACGTAHTAGAARPPLSTATQMPLRLSLNNPLAPFSAGSPAAVPTSVPLAAKGPRPPDGETQPAERSGRGRLEIQNGDDSDAYVTVARDGRLAFTVYVWKGSSARVDHVADGRYVIYFSTGSGWNGDVRRFTTDVRTARFDNPLTLRSTATVDDGWTVSLRTTVDGTETVTEVPDADVPR